MEIEKILVCSTAHVSKDDMLRLECLSEQPDGSLLITYSTEHWVMVYLYNCPYLDKFSPGFREVFAYAKNHAEEFTWLKLDGDAEELEGFQTYDW